ncbi:MAG: beta-ketoacyl-ACP reductase [Micavibrio aeruginosavorus]|uniref:Beta-ketoacyl-ACP reductase n=1 Tax=Micavibrio aeruginosavorus TaxID=349221 RepID=A0A2W5A3P0_9BACT|nr:MAG: beta-ketoacyl-ACP reductase [Micavibrio aeruginosavorus]PZP56366.1 MAG: beta-ketoacyl-ACP reductase [Micavibrio aeruginosavorus]
MSRIALITGATTGIGAATATALKNAGYQVAVNYNRNDEQATAFTKETNIPAYKWDVRDAQSCLDGVHKIENELGPIDILVNNAGILRDKTIHKMSIEDWTDVITTNLNSCFNMSRAVVSPMKERGFGRIISISSVNGLAGQFGQTNYAAAKAGIIGFTKSLALETARSGITVNVIAPGYVQTAMMESIPEDVLKKIIDRVPVGRLAHPEEIARAILFLADDQSAFITGETLSVNGGLYMQ